jgi:hypothetical protein
VVINISHALIAWLIWHEKGFGVKSLRCCNGGFFRPMQPAKDIKGPQMSKAEDRHG